MAELQARWHQAMAAFDEAQWDRLEGAELPFFRWRWLHHLEASGSIVPREGWQSCHLEIGRAHV